MRWAALTAASLLAVCSPARAAPTLRDLIEISDISGVSVSPDGRWAAFRLDAASLDLNRRRSTWWVVDLSNPSTSRKIADGGDVLWTDAGTVDVESPRWSSTSDALYFRALIDGQVQVWRAGPRTAQAEQVTHDPANVLAFELAAEGSLVYRAGAAREAVRREERRQRDEGVRIDASVDMAQNLFDAVEIEGRPAAQRLSGDWFGRVGLLSNQPTTVKSLDLNHMGADPRETLAAEAPPLPERQGPAPNLLRSPSGFGDVKLVKGSGGMLVEVVRPDGARITCANLFCKDLRVTSAAWRPGHDTVVLAYRDDKLDQGLALWDVASQQVRPLVAPLALLNGGSDGAPCGLTPTVAICVQASVTTAPRLVAVALDTGRVSVLAAPNIPLDLPAEAVETLTWRDVAGRPFTGRLFLPPVTEPKPWPLFLTYYNCGGYLRGGTGDEWPLAILAQHGIAALCINQGRRGIYSDPKTQDARYDSDMALAGIEAIIDLLSKSGRVDRRKVGMGGLSFGSEQTVWVATHSDLLAAASIASGQLEPAYYWMNGIPGRDNHATLKRVWGLGAPDETPEAWKAVSAALNIERFKTPLLMQLPEQEYRFSPELFSRLAMSTTPVELYAFAGEPHVKTQPRHRLAVYQRNIDWFQFWLQGRQDPTSGKSAQYDRWRALRDRKPADDQTAGR